MNDQPNTETVGNTHYAVLYFMGDYDNDHPDKELRGQAPSLTLIAAGPEDFCWDSLVRWTSTHPLRRDEHAEVLARNPAMVISPGRSDR